MHIPMDCDGLPLGFRGKQRDAGNPPWLREGRGKVGSEPPGTGSSEILNKDEGGIQKDLGRKRHQVCCKEAGDRHCKKGYNSKNPQLAVV